MSIEQSLEKYDQTIRVVSKEYGKYNDAIFNKVQFEEWRDLLIARSVKTRELFISNKEAIDELQAAMAADLSDEEMDKVYDYVYSIRNDFNLQDPPVYAFLLKKLIAHYEARNNYPKLSYLYCLYWQTYDAYYVKILRDKSSEIIDIAQRAIIMGLKHSDILKDKAREENNPGYLVNPIIIGINYISEHSKDAQSQMEAVDRYYTDIERYYSLIKDEEVLQGGVADTYMDLLKTRVMGLFAQIIKYHEDELRAFYDFFIKNNISSNDEYVNLLFMAGKNYYSRQKSDSEIIDDLKDMYFKYATILINSGKDDLRKVVELRDRTIGLMNLLMAVTDKSDIPVADKRQVISAVTDQCMKYIYLFSYEEYNLVNNFDDIIIDLFEYNFKYANGMEEKEEIIISFLIRRQPLTFIHCLMVQKIALLITESLLRTDSWMFESVRNVRLSNDVDPGNYRNEEEFHNAILSYVEKVALYHDLGKCAIGSVVNMQTRPLFDSEFAIIKQHPEKSEEVLHNDPDYAIYFDVMKGHHKTCDGKGGYPASFDNTASPYKIFIDIVTIADSVDAATDILGRNYTKGKNFNTVFEELIELSSKRYNVNIVRAISKDVDLREALTKLTGYGRFDIYYSAYHQVEDTVKKQRKTARKKISIRAKMYMALMSFLLLGAGSIIAFHAVRLYSNRETITRHNEEYLSDATTLLSDYVNNTLNDVAAKMDSLSGVLERMYVAEVNQDIRTYLEIFNDGTVFDQVDYATSGGILHTLNHEFDCKDSPWFLDAMEGNEGYTYIDRMPVTGRPAILFYKPVRLDGVVKGVLVGRYEKLRIKEILNVRFLGIYPETLLVDNDGKLIVASGENALYTGKEGVMSGLKSLNYVSGSYQELEQFFSDENRTNIVLRYREQDGVSIVSVSRVGKGDWCIIQFFPAGLNSDMTRDLNRFNNTSTITIVLILLVTFTILVTVFYRQRERLEKAIEAATSDKEKLITALKDANARAVESAAEANVANKAKSEFLASMSHELRTPMNAVIGMTDVMLREDHSDEDMGYLMNIKSSGQALLQIINDILDLSKIEAGKMELIEQEYDFLSLLGDLSMMFWNRIGTKNIELVYDIDPSMPAKMIGDSARVRQVLINIVNNAIKFTDEGSILVKAYLEPETEDNRISIRFAVKDTGIGIKEEDQGKLFGTFERLDQQRNKGIEGTGLGLSITKRLVDMMGGEIHVESVYGSGSEFIFTLKQKLSLDGKAPGAVLDDDFKPGSDFITCMSDNTYIQNAVERLSGQYNLTYQEKSLADGVGYIFADEDGYESNAGNIESARSKGARLFILRNPFDKKGTAEGDVAAFKPLFSRNFCQCLNGRNEDTKAARTEIDFTAPDARILLAEDIDMNVKVAKALFAPLAFSIDVAENGQKAVEMVQKNHYDLVLMDHMMPVMDGVEATYAIRHLNDDYYHKLPIIALSANVIESIRESFYAAGMNDVASKPIEIEAMCDIFRKWLPADKIVESKGQVISAPKEVEKPDWFPDGLDFELAMKSSYTEDILLDNLKNFYLMIDVNASKIENCLKDGLIKDYTIEVHGLKNSARYIGAAQLSQFFERMELAGNSQDMDTINRETPNLIKEFVSFKDVLKDFDDSDEDLPLIDTDELCDLMQGIVDAVEAFDTDMVDTCIEDLGNYSVPENIKELKRKLILDVTDVKMDDAKEDAVKILAIIKI